MSQLAATSAPRVVNTRLTIGEYEASLVVENEKVEHYEIDVDEVKKVATCWVASTAGKHFGICVKKRHERFSCYARFFIDGVESESGLHLDDMRKRRGLGEITGLKTYRPLLFGTVDYTDDDSLLVSQTNEDLGNINVQVDHISNFRILEEIPIDNLPLMNRKVHEKAKKALTHNVTLGETKSIDSENPFITLDFDFHGTVATFVFRYRSLDLLKASGIAPCDPSSQSANDNTPSVSGKRKHVLKEENEDNETLTGVNSEDERDMEEEAQLEVEIHKTQLEIHKAQLEIHKARLEMIRKTRLQRNATKLPNKKVKLESKPVFLSGEVIDLTI